MDANTTDIDNLFKKGNCIVSVQENGQTKVALCDLDKTFPETDKWKIISHNERDQTEVSTVRQYKSPYEDVLENTGQFHIGFYLVRDLLNIKKLNSFGNVFMFDNIQVSKVIICGTIISVERKNQHYRLVINDGTSSILCLKKLDEEVKVESGQFKNRNHADSFDNDSLGKTVKIIGYLKEYLETNFIFANHISWISQQGFVDFMVYINDFYRLKNSCSLER